MVDLGELVDWFWGHVDKLFGEIYRHETPIWLDELLERYEITMEEFYMQQGLGRSTFWATFYSIDPDKREEAFRLEAFSKKYWSVREWVKETTAKTSAYTKRITRYLEKYPFASLKEARGH